MASSTTNNEQGAGTSNNEQGAGTANDEQGAGTANNEQGVGTANDEQGVGKGFAKGKNKTGGAGKGPIVIDTGPRSADGARFYRAIAAWPHHVRKAYNEMNRGQKASFREAWVASNPARAGPY